MALIQGICLFMGDFRDKEWADIKDVLSLLWNVK